MDAEIFAEWLKRQGHKVYRTSSSYWFNAGPRVLQAFPYHWVINPGKDELRSLMIKHGIAALRYSSPFDSSEGKLSYHMVLDEVYNFDTLTSKVRSSLRRGQSRFKVEQITFERLAKDGWGLQLDTLMRQNRLKSMIRKEWDILCRSAEDLPGFEIFAAITEDELAAALIICKIDDVYSILYAMSHSRFLRDNVNAYLLYSVSCELLNRGSVTRIFHGLQSLDAPESVDKFKLHMGYRPQLVRQNVAIHPFLKPLNISILYRINQRILEHNPTNHFLAKTEGMLRFHLEGLSPATEQNLPDCLKKDIKVLEGLK